MNSKSDRELVVQSLKNTYVETSEEEAEEKGEKGIHEVNSNRNVSHFNILFKVLSILCFGLAIIFVFLGK